MARRSAWLALSAVLVIATVASLRLPMARGDYPKPSPYPITWEFTFRHQKPQRIVVDDKAYWFLPYTVINNTDQERIYLPIFEMLTNDGTVVRSDRNIPYAVFQAIKKQTKNPFLEHFTQVGGEILLGEDQAKDGVAIWPEPQGEMGQFSIFVAGLSGEAVTLKDSKGQVMKDKDGNPVILRKTLQLNYFVRGDDVYPGEDEVNENPEQWIMR